MQILAAVFMFLLILGLISSAFLLVALVGYALAGIAVLILQTAIQRLT